MPSRPISLDDLIALNDEILALVRAGVPLGPALESVGHDLSGRLGRLTAELGQRLESGQTLDQALADSREALPPVYRAVVAAGVKSGRLSAALEALASTARRLAEVRRVVMFALVYPLVVVLVAYGVFMVLITKELPMFERLGRLGDSAAFRAVINLGQHTEWWGPYVPLAIVAAAGLWWYRSSRVTVLTERVSRRWLAWIPSLGGLVATARTATLADLLALLIEHQAPLDQAVVLAAEATGDRGMSRAAQEIAARLRQGAIAGQPWQPTAPFPPSIAWLLTSSQPERTLAPLLRHTADMYRRRALRQADWLRFYFPPLLTIALGGTAVLLYVLALYIPYSVMLEQLAGVFSFAH